MKTQLSAAILAASALAASGCGSDKTRTPEEKREPVTVTVLTVKPGPSLSTANYVGRVEPSKNTVVLNSFPGTVEVLNAVKGRTIKEGEVIAKINSEAVKSAYDIAKATLAQAEDGYARAEKVYGAGGVTEVKMIEIRTQLEKARAAEKSAAEAMENCIVKAPFSGVAGEVFVHAGEKVAAAAPMVQIMDVSNIEVHFNVPENEYAGIRVGDRAEIEIPALGRTTYGRVAVKGLSASQLSHAYDFTLKGIANTVSMMPGMVCKVRIAGNEGECIVIPAAAVKTDMESRFVWGVKEDGTVCKIRITPGGYRGKGIVVASGLKAGDKVITEGCRKVSSGMKVKAVEQ